ncbi:molybdopterin-dependent oxidoreductase [Saccharopolyspora sp. HNM0983]|uniref:Molybdopterin-dependent oxidoreductase n=1 Tax=Saccharopolyspora montiporae TaxID=2781240 RepID=A0A929FYU7_9PSEU|nr:molybdopterin-dependent oxidoreductase [Saccharopolyspora sp. HNM0983]MBE9373850.1 molybdopterin-dependent oxidoreductase [Saccharopolyspora sp. HNM0983]
MRRHPGRRALSGVLAAAVALAAGHLLAATTAPNASPFLAVGSSAIDLAPRPLKEFAVRQFGEQDKTVLLAGMAVTVLVLAAAAGLLSRRGPLPGVVLITGFGLLGSVAAATRPDLGPLGVLPSLLATGIGVLAFTVLVRGQRRDCGDRGRRDFLLSAGALGAGAVVLGTAGTLASSTGTAARTADRALRERIPPLTPARSGTDFARLGTPRFHTRNADFYRVDTALTVPRLDAGSWRLRVHGMVERERDIDLADLLRRPRETVPITMTCVSNEVGGPYVSTAEFTGVPIADVLAEAGVLPGAEQLFSTSSDGYTAGTPLDAVTDPARPALLAYGMNGEPLPAEHGYPVRMVTSGLYGYLSATKWLVDLKLTTFDEVTYWEERGWAEHAPIKTQSRIDRPRPFDALAAGRTTVAGVAWAQPHGIRQVEVSVDDGPWRSADLSAEVSGHTWRMWRIEVDLPPGGHEIRSRATDRTGRTQTRWRQGTVPDGATGHHSVFCTARN